MQRNRSHKSTFTATDSFQQKRKDFAEITSCAFQLFEQMYIIKLTMLIRTQINIIRNNLINKSLKLWLSDWRAHEKQRRKGCDQCWWSSLHLEAIFWSLHPVVQASPYYHTLSLYTLFSHSSHQFLCLFRILLLILHMAMASTA